MELKIVLVVLTALSAQPALLVRQSNQLLLNVARSMEQELLSRNKRQLVTNPQSFNVRNAVLNIPVPVNIPFYPGEDVKIDNCRRDEVLVESPYYNKPMCMKLLHRGNCKHDQIIAMDPDTKKGYCTSRLCPPDRIFVHATQLCHDPQDTDACPVGRELFNTAHGSAICDCPDGTTESSNGMYGDVCEVLLTENRLCQKGQIYWYKDFRSLPQCLPDPCNGSNLGRRPNSLPFVPSQLNGKCHQLGQTTGVCQPGLIYALHLPSLRGVCETLENLGYDLLNQEELSALNRLYGVTIVKNNALSPPFGQNLVSSSFGQISPSSFGQISHSSFGQNALSSPFGQSPLTQSFSQPSTETRHQGNQFSHEQVENADLIMSDYGLTFLRSLGFKSQPVPGILVYHVTIRPSGEVITHVLPYSRSVRSTIEQENEIGETFVFTGDDLLRLLESNKLSKVNSQVAKAILQSSKHYPLSHAEYKSNEPGQVFSARQLSSKNYPDIDASVEPNISDQVFPAELNSNQTISRKKRQVQSHASPSNVFETRLQSCSAGAARDLNSKCRDTILPASIPKSRGIRAAPPISPAPSCPAGQAYNFRRTCSSAGSVQNSNLASRLG